MKQLGKIREQDEQGFVLLAVLALTGAIGALALAVSLVTRDDYAETKLARDLALARLHADNAIVRSIAALGDPGDSLHGPILQSSSAFPLAEQGVLVNLRIEHESGKIDLNRASPEFIANVLGRIAPNAASAMMGRILDMRARGTFIADVRSILSAEQQFEPINRDITEVFTVLSGARGITPDRASPTVLASIPGILPEELELLLQGRRVAGANLSPIMVKYQAYFSPGRPVYTFRALVAQGGLPPVGRRATIALGNLPVRYRNDLAILEWKDE